MSKMIQIRNVPDEVHRTLKARSAQAGLSLSELILQELHALVVLPSEQELLDQLNETEPFAMKVTSARIIRKDRDAA